MTDALDRLAPEDPKGELYRHADEGLDDMPAHIKSALVGASVSVPITEGKMNLGTWQGVWLMEFREERMTRRVVATVMGDKKK
jgi:secondary thiamine-phosphate synthase enzyme